MRRDTTLIIKSLLFSLPVLLGSFTFCSVTFAVEIVLQFDDFDRIETQANIMSGIDGFYDPEFNDFNVEIPLDGVDSEGNTGTLLVAQLSGFGNNGATSSRIRTFNEGAGVSNSNGSAINGGDTIELTFNQPVTIRSYSVAFTTTNTNMFYRVGDISPVDLVIPEMTSPQLIDIPDSQLPAGEPFVVGSNDFQFMLWQTVIEYAGSVSQPTVINVPPDPAPSFVAANTQLNLLAGGSIGDDFDALDGSEVNISGGSVGDRFASLSGSSVNISGGSFGPIFDAAGTVRISGGSFDCCFNAFGEVTVSGGSFTNAFQAFSGSLVNISGGSIGRDFRALGGSEVNISGGTMGDNFDTSSASNLSFVGGNYHLDGVPILGLSSTGDTLSINLPDGSVLSGVFADGTPFAFSSADADTIRNGTLTLKVDSLPGVGPANISLPTDPVPLGLRTSQTLVVNAGGVVGNDFSAEAGSTIYVSGGDVGNNFEAVDADVTISDGSVGFEFDAFSGSKVNISGGSIGINFQAHRGSEVNIAGGLVGNFFRAADGSKVNIFGGIIGDGFRAFGGSEVNISGGDVGGGFTAFEDSEVNISGGTVGINFQSISRSEVNISGGSVGNGFRAPDGSMVNLFGTQFVLDGVDITDSLAANVAAIISDRNVTLSGLLTDGSQFSFVLNSQFSSGEDFFGTNAILSVTLVPEPASVFLLLFAMITGLSRSRKGRPLPSPINCEMFQRQVGLSRSVTSD